MKSALSSIKKCLVNATAPLAAFVSLVSPATAQAQDTSYSGIYSLRDLEEAADKTDADIVTECAALVVRGDDPHNQRNGTTRVEMLADGSGAVAEHTGPASDNNNGATVTRRMFIPSASNSELGVSIAFNYGTQTGIMLHENGNVTSSADMSSAQRADLTPYLQRDRDAMLSYAGKCAGTYIEARTMARQRLGRP